MQIINSNLEALLEYQNIKTCLQKVTFQIGLEKFSWFKRLKILFGGHVINNLNGEEIFGTFYENELQNATQKNLELKK